MAAKQLILCDSNVIIRLFQGHASIKKILDEIGEEQRAASVVTYSEIIYGTRKDDIPKVKTFFRSIRLIHISEAISRTFIGISLNYSYRHHIKIPDALIAATAITLGPLYTENKKDFDFIPEVKFYK